MKNIIKIIWLISIVFVLFSMLWFLFGSTACFQKNIDLVSTVIFIIAWIPASWFVVSSFIALKKGWLPNNMFAKFLLIIGVLTISFILITTFLNNSSPYGWLKEHVTKDYIQTTVDEKYEYRMEIVNIFQRNSYVQLYLNDISNGEEIKITLDISTREMHAISGGEGSIYPEPEKPPVWSNLMPTDNKYIYILTTTKVFDRDNIYCFQINVKNKTAKLM